MPHISESRRNWAESPRAIAPTSFSATRTHSRNSLPCAIRSGLCWMDKSSFVPNSGKIMRGKTNWLYWGCQIAGWGVYSVVGLTIATLTTGWHAGTAIGFALFFVYSIACTHWMRGFIRRRGWLALPPIRGFPRIFSTAIAVGFLLAALVV